MAGKGKGKATEKRYGYAPIMKWKMLTACQTMPSLSVWNVP